MSLKVFYPRSTASLHSAESEQRAWANFVKSLDPKIELIAGSEIPEPAEYHLIIAGRPTHEQLTASPNLHTVVIPWAGLPDITRDRLENYPKISVYNLHHNAITTAESALMLMFAAAKRIIPIDRVFREHDWRPRYAPNEAVYLYGKTVLVLGFGSIGQHVAWVCQGMGMQVIGIKRHPGTPLPEGLDAAVYQPEALHELLPQANVLIVSLPLTEETQGLLGEVELALLPDDAILVNVGRAAVVDQGALYQALRDGKLHSAGLDVWYNYPPDEDSRADTPPADYPFHELDNVVMSPHRGGHSMEVEITRLEHLTKLLNQLAREGQASNKINLELGY